MKNNWKEFELVLALRLYYQLPFGKMHKGNKEIICLSKIINRTPSAVAMKLSNFARLDTKLQQRSIKGLTNGGRQDKVVWDLYNNTAILEEKSNEIMSWMNDKDLTNLFVDYEVSNVSPNLSKLISDSAIKKGRDKQSFFRKIVISNFNGKCCITGLEIPQLLVASHIIPWSKNEEHQLNPQNGFLLNSIHDKAFDRGLITIDKEMKIRLSNEIKKLKVTPFVKNNFLDIENKSITLPEKYSISEECINYHNNFIFKK